MSPITGTVNKMKNMLGINSFGGTGHSGSVKFVGTSNMHDGYMNKMRGYTTNFHHKAKEYSANMMHKGKYAAEYIAGPALLGMNNLAKAAVEAPAKAVRAVAPSVGGTRAVRTSPVSPTKSRPTGGSISAPRPKKSRTRPKRQADRRARRARRQQRNVRNSKGRRPVPRGAVKSISYAVPSGDADEVNFVGVGGIDS